MSPLDAIDANAPEDSHDTNDGADDVADGVGEALRVARQSRGLSTRALAHLAGVGQSTLSNIENGRVLPSVRTLFTLAEALGIGPGELLPRTARDDDDDEHSHPPALSDESGDPPVVVELLHASPDSVLETYRIEQRAGYRDRTLYRHTGEDVIHVLEGRVTLVCGAARMTLSAGDTVWLEGTTPHSFSTPRSSGVVALIITCRGASDLAARADARQRSDNQDKSLQRRSAL